MLRASWRSAATSPRSSTRWAPMRAWSASTRPASSRPRPCKEKKNVGYMRALSTEGVISVGATLIIASERAGPPEVVKTLKTTSVPYVEVPDQYSPLGIAAKVRLVARAVGAEAEGEKVGEPGRGRLQGAGGRHAGASSGRSRPCSCWACRMGASASAGQGTARARHPGAGRSQECRRCHERLQARSPTRPSSSWRRKSSCTCAAAATSDNHDTDAAARDEGRADRRRPAPPSVSS